MPSIQDLLTTLSTNGSAQYGHEAVTQRMHALQCATLAESALAPPALVVACLLHDFGHVVHSLGDDAVERGINDRHEKRALSYLDDLFVEAVTRPIRLHVRAKRYLCAVDSSYWDGLSPASKRSLELQGGIFSEEEAIEFINQPYAKDAVQLRIWDDLAKNPNMTTPDFHHFLPVLSVCQK
ncbi:MAG: putative HD phosphohydrolase [Phormidesmis priestleyi Ana]|uniref:Putative HD phosphohydrolase n=1 Tax=Phormidesmis priestleyi Ana TaxID=1666911 RepID=A0A0P8BSN9_9CYAN|nr:MAG: putative HD phosphohydrolase [Phormidesmis priestleyi Ana]